MIGITIRSANRKASTPAKLIPPDHRTAASGTLPTEQTKLSTAMIGPTITFSIVGTAPARCRGTGVEEAVAELGDEPGEQEAERDLLPQHLPVAAEVVRDVRPARTDVSRSRQRQPLAGRVVLVAACRPRSACSRACGLELAARRTAAAARVISTIITIPPTYSASVNCQPISTHRTRPSSHTRLVEANWNASARGRRGALLEQRLGDRDRRVGA